MTLSRVRCLGWERTLFGQGGKLVNAVRGVINTGQKVIAKKNLLSGSSPLLAKKVDDTQPFNQERCIRVRPILLRHIISLRTRNEKTKPKYKAWQ